MAPIIEIAGLAKSYPGNATPAVQGVSFSVERGEIFGLLGPNGAGKTTLISMLSCLLAPSAGSARVAGYELAGEQSEVKRVIGLVPQDLALYPTLSTRQNLEHFGALYGLSGAKLAERVRAALAMVRLEERAEDAVEKLSGGMKRRANIAAGLLHEPQVLFLDEPTVGVDPQSRNFIFEGVEALKNAGLTVIYTTHYMEEAQRLCDRVAIIDRGAVIALDSPEAMVTAHGGSIVIEVGGNAAGAAAAVGALAGVRGVQRDGSRLTIAAANPARILGPIIEKTAGAGGEVSSVEVVNDNLESVFLDLTGRRLRD